MKIIIAIIVLLSTFTWANEKVSLQLKWKHQFQFAGYYMAKEKGFYDDVGLDVELKTANNNQDTTQEVLEGISTFGISDSVLVYDKMTGNDIVLLGAIFQHSPLVLLSLKNNNIQSIEDIYDKTIMLDSNIRNSSPILAMLKKYNSSPSKMQFLESSYDIEDLIDGKTDLYSGYISNEIYLLEKYNIQYNALKPYDYGFDFYGDIIFTSKKELTNNPKRVENFYHATLKGWEYAFNHIDETIKVILDKYNTQNYDYEHYLYEANTLKILSEVDMGNLGKIERNRINKIINMYFLLTKDTSEVLYDDLVYTKKTNTVEKNSVDNLLKTVNICIEKDNMPYEKIIQNDLIGINSELINILRSRFKIVSNIIEVNSYENKIQALQSHKCDLAFGLIEKDTSNFLISHTYLEDSLVLATGLDKIYLSHLGQAREKKLGLLKSKIDIKESIQEIYPRLLIVDFNTIDEGMSAITNGEIYGFLDYSNDMAYSIQRNYFKQVKQNGNFEDLTIRYVAGVHASQPLLHRAINEIIYSLSQEDIIQMERKWIKVENAEFYDKELMLKISIITIIIGLMLLYRQYILQKLNKQLKIDVAKEVENNRKKDHILFHQTKLATMGEMINSIAHQWRQPLNEINSIVMTIDYIMMQHKISNSQIDQKLQSIERHTKYMSNTIDDFRDYFKPNKMKKEFTFEQVMDQSLKILEATLSKYEINIDKIVYNDFKNYNYLGEMVQVLITIVNNAKDALVQNNVKNPKITIVINNSITIEDNAGGIPKNYINKIFEPYFTTKGDKHGTGIGLHMSKVIMESSLDGKIEVVNSHNGAKFTLKLNTKEEDDKKV
ncbi:MAG: ABC transporter substrate-binding protein [Campylobacterota bacterium]|nr:ABC transporter substrate-binding protein [Campylobacterota bacterium]